MYRYIARRLLYAIPAWAAVVIFIFVIIRVLPGDPIAEVMGTAVAVTPQQLALIKEQMGLDQPIYKQFGVWVKGVLRLDLGNSLIAPSIRVSDRIKNAIPVSFELMLLATTIGLLIAVPVGVISAIRQDSALDYGGRLFSIAGLSVPNFFIATLAILMPAIWWGWSPPVEYTSFVDNPIKNLKIMVPPALVLGYGLSATTARMLRSTMLEILRADYIRTAFAKGLQERSVIVRHALKNALIPVVTIVGTQMGFLLGGSIIVEQIFGLPGMGAQTFQGISKFDYPQVQANVMFMATVMIFMNLFIDVLYGWFDPRIRYN